MSSSPRDSDDMQRSLLSISKQHPMKITSQLVDIQSAKLPQEKSIDFLKDLKCLCVPNKRKRRFNTVDAEDTSRELRCERINAFENSDYVALSYTWCESHYETDHSVGGYKVQQTNSSQFEKSPVRDSVFRRTMAYMDSISVRYLWIDQHCTEQEEGEEKEIGMNAMDRVYSLSQRPVALLYRSIETLAELNVLKKILTGSLVEESGWRFQLSSNASQDEALGAIELLKYITSDTWFSRGWIFQENYRAGIEMTLLMPHSSKLNKSKPIKLLGSLDGELCITSVDLHEGATKLCLAYQSSQPPRATPYEDPCDEILARAAKYTVLLQNSPQGALKSMTPTILSDLGRRKLTKNWDLLAIAANCCQYSIRLDSVKLKEKKHSLSLSILALCLLNGEVLWNHPRDGHNAPSTKKLNIAQLLEKQFFDGIRSPSPRKSLTFNKGCRFDKVKLTEEGIETRGHLWKLRTLISTESSQDSSYDDDDDDDDEIASSRISEAEVLGRLEELVENLYSCGEEFLAGRLRGLVNMMSNGGRPQLFKERWQDTMAGSIATAIGQGKTLGTARPVNTRLPGNAIFIVDTDEESDTNGSSASSSSSSSSSTSNGTSICSPEDPTYVFTSFWPGRVDSEEHDSNDIEKHVSMEVESLDLLEGRHGLPRLFTKRWINGLCFFDGYPLQDVVFPWPESIQGL